MLTFAFSVLYVASLLLEMFVLSVEYLKKKLFYNTLSCTLVNFDIQKNNMNISTILNVMIIHASLIYPVFTVTVKEGVLLPSPHERRVRG